MHRRQHAAVRDRGVGARHLEHGDADLLAERHRRQRERAPAGLVREDARGLAFELDARLLAESEGPDRLVERSAAERHRDVRDPDVRGVREDVPDRQRAPAFSSVLVNRFRPDRERAAAAVDRVVERDRARVERRRGRHDLERRPRLVGVRERSAAPRVGVHLPEPVRVERGIRGERENRSRRRIENDRRGPFRVRLGHDLCELAFGRVLDGGPEREGERRSLVALGRGVAAPARPRRVRTLCRVAEKRDAGRLAAHVGVEAIFEARETLVVGADVAQAPPPRACPRDSAASTRPRAGCPEGASRRRDRARARRPGRSRAGQAR